MIFVTVGTTKFDDLIKKIDILASKKLIKEKVLMQIGEGKYIPKYSEWFRYKPSLDSYYKKASLVISHSGAGTLLELINKKKKTIVVINPDVVKNPDIVIKLSEEKHILWCKNIKKLNNCIKKARLFKFKKYRKPGCKIHKKIIEFLKNI